MEQEKKLKIIQKNELSILIEIKRLCEKYSLRYCLAYGSCLGAVRHNGFIPWDDDIDVLMPLQDYRVFVEVCKKEMSKDFFLQTFETDANYFYAFGKIRKNDTTFILWNSKNHHIHQGFWVDIFPVVKTPQRKISKRIINSLIRFSAYLQMFDFLNGYERSKSEVGAAKYNLARVLNKLPQKTRIDLHKKILNLSLGSPKEEDELSALFISLIPEINGCCFNTIDWQFEGIMFPIPRDYDKHLKLWYGDYMVLPPEDKRYSHYSVIVDENKSYEEYMK